MPKRFLLTVLVPVIVVVAAVPGIGATRGLSAGENVRWTGEAPGLGVIGENDQLLARYGEAPGCDPVTCDLHEIVVGEAGELVVAATDALGGIEVDVFRPDGTFVSRVGLPGEATTVTLPDAAPGRYLVQVTTSQSIDRGGAFAAAATLR